MGNSSVVGLVRELVDEAGALARTEIELVRTETKANLSTAQQAVGAMAGGAAVLHAGILALAACAILALDRIWPSWLAALVVGGVLTAIGGALVAGAKQKIRADALKPRHTLNTLQRTADFMRDQKQRATEKWQ